MLLLFRIRQQVIPDVLGSQVPARSVGTQRIGDARKQYAHGGQTLLPVHDTIDLHHAGTRLLHRDHGPTVVRSRLVLGVRDRQHIVHQAMDLGLSPDIPTLPPRHEILDLQVEELEKGGFLCFHAGCCDVFAGDGREGGWR